MGSTGKLNISDTEQETLLDVPAPADENNTQQIKKQRDPKKRPFYSKPKFKMYVFIFSLIIIPLLNFLVFWVYVSFDTVLLTFQKFSVRTGEYEWVGFANYGEVFRDYIFGIGNAYPEKQQILRNRHQSDHFAAFFYRCIRVFQESAYGKIFPRVLLSALDHLDQRAHDLFPKSLSRRFRSDQNAVCQTRLRARLAERGFRTDVDAHLYLLHLGGAEYERNHDEQRDDADPLGYFGLYEIGGRGVLAGGGYDRFAAHIAHDRDIHDFRHYFGVRICIATDAHSR